ncbi:C40 family peptidase [Brevibacillus fulvus]|uniref:Cell wall-associated NlpC family hydrolase n=1 Tax=Brevibacillus fulvus TaxID=1125967 RepID=A0A938Y2I5_9BACL|nr:C40 family peptidase [Brevibacillus fulvus]MBM7592091.1 cell wall-associated NlpC family hydrolase [Brevibacillus fulvus]
MKKWTTTALSTLVLGASLFTVNGQASAATTDTANVTSYQVNEATTNSFFNQNNFLNYFYSHNRYFSQPAAPTEVPQAAPVKRTDRRKAPQATPVKQPEHNETIAKPVQQDSQATGSIGDQVIEAGKKYLGTPYRFGASSNTTSAFDCSSFTQRAFKDIGISLPRNSRQQSTVGETVSIDQLQKGDLVFFRTAGSSSSRITHVAIYAGNNQLLHTFGDPGVTFTKFAGTNWEKRFVTARRVS